MTAGSNSRWGFKLPDRLLFNARSEGIDSAKFWKDSFQEGRCIVPADAIFEWQQTDKGKQKPKYEIIIPGQERSGWQVCGSSGRIRRQVNGSAHLPSSLTNQMNSCSRSTTA